MAERIIHVPNNSFGPSFDSERMFWRMHREKPLPPLPENFHGPAPPPVEEDEADYR